MQIIVIRKDAEYIIARLTLLGYKKALPFKCDFWSMYLDHKNDRHMICIVNQNMLHDPDVKQLLIEYII